MAQHHGHLGAVYGAAGPQEVAALYDRWAETYESEMARAGYRHPAIGVALLARHLPRGARPLLDAGAGTGLLGEWLEIVGYPEVEALDISAGMLEVARAKGIYARCHNLPLGVALPFRDGAFAGIISTGVFTTGHVGAEALPELLRICRPGGVIVLTVKESLWQGGFAVALEAAVASGRAGLAEMTEPYVSMPGEPGTTPSRAVALRVTP
ncbi:class I SAM-dependent DNA methyltransferase [Cereibacter sphaeroides]|uniref:class I SAM-dependent DNA methyltransferase n=1 Tax=Cereibacter sphaeroides TaxID=1063 RepID=UPI00313C9C81